MHMFHTNRKFIRYVLPSVFGMAVQALYVVLDGIIVGQGIGEIGLAAINIAFPSTMVVIALAMLISAGGANVYSFYKGQGKTEKTNAIFNQCLALSVVVGVLLALTGFAFRQPLAVFLGANEILLPSTTAYLKWITAFSFLQMLACCLSIFIRNDDSPKLVMFATVTGAVVNAILDAILILVLHYGIEVSAITNGVGIFIELMFYATHFVRKRGVLRICWTRFDMADMKRIFSNGFSTFLMELSLPCITFSFNIAIVRTIGTLGITAYSIVGYVCAIINMVLVGVTQGAQPLMSFYHGKGDKKEFAHVYRLGILSNIMVSVFLVSLCVVFSGDIVSLFRADNPALMALTSHMMRLYPLAHVAIGITLMNILYFQTTERNLFSTLVSFLRCVGFVQVFILLSVFCFNGQGLYLTFFAGELSHLVVSQIMVKRTMRLEGKPTTP